MTTLVETFPSHPQRFPMRRTKNRNVQPQHSLPPIASIESEPAAPWPIPPPEAVDPVLWPFEPFPDPPADGFWIPKYAPPPPPKFRSVIPEIPPPPLQPLSPPFIAPTYPPAPPLDEKDPRWLFRMLEDVQRQRQFLIDTLEETYAEAANAYAEVGLAEVELEQEKAAMQGFINTVASVAGSGFVRRMLADVDYYVDRMSKGLNTDHEVDIAGGENGGLDDSGYESSVSSSSDIYENPQPNASAGS